MCFPVVVGAYRLCFFSCLFFHFFYCMLFSPLFYFQSVCNCILFVSFGVCHLVVVMYILDGIRIKEKQRVAPTVSARRLPPQGGARAGPVRRRPGGGHPRPHGEGDGVQSGRIAAHPWRVSSEELV